MIAFISLITLLSIGLFIILSRSNRHIFLRDRRGRFTAKVKKIEWVGGEHKYVENI